MFFVVQAPVPGSWNAPTATAIMGMMRPSTT
jgi:hypothetical protein